jgi:hypothetical protein
MNNQVQTPKTDAANSKPAATSVKALPVDHAGEIPCPPCHGEKTLDALQNWIDPS